MKNGLGKKGIKKTGGGGWACFVPAGEMFPLEKLPGQRGSESNKAKEGMLVNGLSASRYCESGSRELKIRPRVPGRATQTPRPSSKALREGARAAGLPVSPGGIKKPRCYRGWVSPPTREATAR